MNIRNIDIVHREDFMYSIEGHDIQMSQLALSLIDLFIQERKDELNRPFRYLEFGSGASTAYFATKYPDIEIFSVEGDKEWYEKVKTWVKPKVYEYHEATNYYTTKNDCNMNYINCMEKYGPFDLILNDGAQREMVADYIFANHEKYIADKGIYLRHDYEKYLIGDWVGYHLPKIFDTEFKPYTAESFALEHPEYSSITINGNGRWGWRAELGGVWKR